MSTSLSGVSTNYFPSPQNGFTTTTAGSVASGAATVTLNSVAGYTNGQVAVLVIDPTDASKKQTFLGIVDTAGVQLTSVKWTAGTNQTHALGATVVDYATATHIGMITKGLLAAGILQTGLMTPKIQTSINDSGGNEAIRVPVTASAVNDVTVTNAATGAAPSISATGDDSAINLNLRGKGLAKTVTIGAGAAPIWQYDFVYSGCVLSADAAGSTLNFSMTSGVVVINGNPVTVASFSAAAATASRDTYVDVLDNGDGTGLVVKTGGNIVTNNAASPALASNSTRIGIVVSGAGNIAAAASINQGQEDRVLPIASSVAYSVTDSLGNLICPRDPQRKILGYRQIIANPSNFSSTSAVILTGLSAPVIVPTARKVKVTVFVPFLQAGAALTTEVSIWDGTVGSGTRLQASDDTLASAAYTTFNVSAPTTPATASKTYNAGVSVTTNAVTVSAGSTNPAYIMVELA